MNLGQTADNDLDVINGNLQLITGDEEIAQLLKNRLLSFRGEWFLNLELGLPYFEQILEKATSLSAIEGIYLKAITETPGVRDIETFRLDFDPATRQIDLSFRARTSNGVIDFNLGDINGNV